MAVSLYPNVAFSADEVELIRPLMVYALLDAPPLTRATLGLELGPVAAAADALSDGDEGPARQLIDDGLLDRLVVRGTTLDVGRRLATLARRHARRASAWRTSAPTQRAYSTTSPPRPTRSGAPSADDTLPP